MIDITDLILDNLDKVYLIKRLFLKKKGSAKQNLGKWFPQLWEVGGRLRETIQVDVLKLLCAGSQVG